MYTWHFVHLSVRYISSTSVSISSFDRLSYLRSSRMIVDIKVNLCFPLRVTGCRPVASSGRSQISFVLRRLETSLGSVSSCSTLRRVFRSRVHYQTKSENSKNSTMLLHFHTQVKRSWEVLDSLELTGRVQVLLDCRASYVNFVYF